ncbi:unnamed protein product [Arabidopsis halleri]
MGVSLSEPTAHNSCRLLSWLFFPLLCQSTRRLLDRERTQNDLKISIISRSSKK